MGKYRFLGGAAAVALLVPTAAWGQAESSSPEQETQFASLDEVIVTARKRQESLLEIPLAVTAFDESQIQNAGIQGLEDVSFLTSGFQFSNQGGQQPGRYNTQLRFRGMNTAQQSPTFATGALFVDGIYVLNGGTSLSLMDVERIEVIKGPQSAYFGRNTFGGAVNYITRNPSLDTFSSQIEGLVTTRGTYELSGITEIPVVEDTLGISLSARLYDKRGHYVATDGGRLGNESTIAFNAAAYYEPTDNFSFKLRGSYSRDDDGAPAGGFVSGGLNDSCTGLSFTAPSGETATPRNYICGEVPGIDDAITSTGQSVISTNTSVLINQTVTQQDFSTIPGAGSPSFTFDQLQTSILPSGLPTVDDIGLERETIRFSAHAEYEFDNGMSLDVIGGYNEQNANWIRDFDLTDRYNWFSRDPQAIEDYSGEVRLSSNQEGRFRWLVGANYYDQTFTTSGAGGDNTTGCFAFFATDDYADCGLALLFRNTFINSDESEVFGLFGSIDWDVTDELTFIFEGRYQDDTLNKAGTLSENGISDDAFSLSSKTFLPRAIIRYQPTPDTNLYASFAQGVLQGDVNTFFANADAQERAQYQAQIPTAAESTPDETLDSYEIGWKQSLFDNRANVNLSAYYYQWEGIKGRSTAVIFETCDAAKQGDPVCAGIPLGDVATVPNPRNILVPGDADLWGIEFEGAARLTENWDATLNVTWAQSEYKDYIFNFVAPISGFSNMRGNQQPRFPEWSGNMSSTYNFDVGNGWDGYVRGDIIYFGEAFVDESNLAYTEDYFLANVRFGGSKDGIRLEAFIRNLFDEDAYAAGARWTDFSRPTFFPTLTQFQGVAVTGQDKREFGLRTIIDF